jgi:hypothetical protein
VYGQVFEKSATPCADSVQTATVHAVTRVLCAAVIVLALGGCARNEDRLTEARRLLRDDSLHQTAVTSADTMGRIVSLLRAEARCTDRTSRPCLARHSLAAYAQVVGIETARCTPAGRRDLRAAIDRYITTVKTMTKDDRVPGPPPVPHCG